MAVCSFEPLRSDYSFAMSETLMDFKELMCTHRCTFKEAFNPYDLVQMAHADASIQDMNYSIQKHSFLDE